MNRRELKPVKDILLASSIMIIPRAFYRGVILYFCWLWFAVPMGFAPLNIWVAIVAGGVVSILTFEHMGETKSCIAAFEKMIEWLIAASVFFAFAALIYFLELTKIAF